MASCQGYIVGGLLPGTSKRHEQPDIKFDRPDGPNSRTSELRRKGVPMTFNLVDEQWIPVLYHDGTWTRVGVRKALEDAHAIRIIAASNPMDRVAILRFLLALLYWCKGSPTEGAIGIKDAEFPPGWFSKIDEHRHLFELLGKDQRFYQSIEYRGIKAEHTANYLIHEVPSGTNKWHFRHATDMKDGLCEPCCAMGLLRLPAFATSGGAGNSPGINSAPPVYVLPIGRSLAETLRTLWQPTKVALGTPEWETPNVALPENGEVPVLVGLTWVPRNVWLSEPDEDTSWCVSCGSTRKLIRRCVFKGKGSQKAEGRIWRDPHVIYETSEKEEVKPLYAGDALGTTDAATGHWTRFVPRASQGRGVCGSGKAIAVGFSTDKTKFRECMEWAIPLLQAPVTEEAMAKFRQWNDEFKRLLQRANPRGENKSSLKHPEILSALMLARPGVENKVSARAGELLTGDDQAWIQASLEYRPIMKAVAGSLSPGFTTKAIERRRNISVLTPDMRPKEERAVKKRRKKGDDQ